MQEVESFKLDHTKVHAPYLRKADEYWHCGECVTKFDVRICQPNIELLNMRAVHTFEHLFAVLIREYNLDVIDFSPMGCRTGFYLTLFGQYNELDILETIKEVFSKISKWNDIIPAATEKECGSYKEHDLNGAKNIASVWLAGIIKKGWHY